MFGACAVGRARRLIHHRPLPRIDGVEIGAFGVAQLFAARDRWEDADHLPREAIGAVMRMQRDFANTFNFLDPPSRRRTTTCRPMMKFSLALERWIGTGLDDALAPRMKLRRWRGGELAWRLRLLWRG